MKKQKGKHRYVLKNKAVQTFQTQKIPTLSVCMIVKNEEENLPRVLSSIQGLADEVIVVDTGSTDRTVEIARSFGAKVYFFEWCDDFSAARNESLRHATCDYILWLDGDDEVPETEHIKIKRDLVEKKGSAFYLHIKNKLQNDENISIQLRIFPNRKGIKFSGRIHEQIYNAVKEANINMFLCNATIIHHGYYFDTKNKLERNRNILLKELNEDPDNTYTLFFLARTLKGLNELNEACIFLNKIIEKSHRDNGFAKSDLFRITLYEKASILYSQGKIDDAISLLKQFEVYFEEDNLLNFTLGEIYYKLKEYEKAYPYLIKLKNETFTGWLLPVNATVCKRNLDTYLGISSLFTKDYATAKMCFNNLISFEPEKKEYYHYLILCEEKAGSIDKAIELCSKACKNFNNDDSFIKKRFFLFLEKGEIGKATNDLDVIIEKGLDLEVIGGGFLLNCLKFDIDKISYFYNLFCKTLFIPEKPFPENYLLIRERLMLLNENRALSFFERGIDYLLKLEQ